mmetsp:Transcript_25973/g.61103  ORF Transcript_25973/g.61103 Transcript_25973/m.61103 type:complete len:110 (-) Transcript_25973:163-492(-)
MEAAQPTLAAAQGSVEQVGAIPCNRGHLTLPPTDLQGGTQMREVREDVNGSARIDRSSSDLASSFQSPKRRDRGTSKRRQSSATTFCHVVPLETNVIETRRWSFHIAWL